MTSSPPLTATASSFAVQANQFLGQKPAREASRSGDWRVGFGSELLWIFSSGLVHFPEPVSRFSDLLVPSRSPCKILVWAPWNGVEAHRNLHTYPFIRLFLAAPALLLFFLDHHQQIPLRLQTHSHLKQKPFFSFSIFFPAAFLSHTQDGSRCRYRSGYHVLLRGYLPRGSVSLRNVSMHLCCKWLLTCSQL